MKFCIANTSYWESIGYNPIHWRKSTNGALSIPCRSVIAMLCWLIWQRLDWMAMAIRCSRNGLSPWITPGAFLFEEGGEVVR